jgi:hypothetical protein
MGVAALKNIRTTVEETLRALNFDPIKEAVEPFVYRLGSRRAVRQRVGVRCGAQLDRNSHRSHVSRVVCIPPQTGTVFVRLATVERPCLPPPARAGMAWG